MALSGKLLKNPLCCLIVLFLLLLPNPSGAASTHVPVGSWVYPALEKLEAEGLLRSGILTSRPVSRAEAARLVKEAESGQPSPGAARVIEKLKAEFAPDEGRSSSYFRPFEEARFKFLYADGTPLFLNINNKGDIIGNGSNFRAGFSSSAGAGSALAFYLNPEFRYPEGASRDGAEVVLVEGYGALNLWNIELTAGRQALWWGSGHHGTLLLTDNARPFDLIKLTNPRPATMPWIFKYIGPIKFTGFVTRLEEDRDFANPYLAGLRLELKPHPNATIGVTRTAMFGGAGRHVDARVIWNVITARNENVAGEPGNQLGSYDLKIVLPFKLQKAVIYGEYGGEDEAGGFPSKAAFVTGAYLPGLLGFERLDLRVEHGWTYIGNCPAIWYVHNTYTSGYTYDGRIIGHHMGTDAKDLFISAAYESIYGDFEVLFDIEVSGRGVKSKKRSAAISWTRALSEVSELSLGYYFDRQTNIDGVIGRNSNSHSVMANLGLNF
jgi:hypothetical protein